MSSTTFEEGLSTTRRLTRGLRWCAGAVAVALAVAGCGGGGGGEVTPTVAAPGRPDQVAAFALTQQSVAARMAPLAGVPASTTGTTGNLILNGSFESGMTGWANWGNATVVTGQASSGTSALAAGPDSGGAGYDVGGVVPGSTYRLTAQARVSVAGDAVYVGVNFLDQWGLPATQNAVRVTGAAYTTVTFEAVAPANAVKAVVYVWKNAGSGLAYVDEFAFAAVDASAPGAASSNNLVTNGGFESGLANWVDWGNSASATQAAAGSSAAQVGTGAGGFGQHVLGGVVPGNRYRLTAQARVSVPGEIGYLGVMFTDDSGLGTALLVQNVVFRSTTYGAVQADVTAPANARRAVVFVWKNDASGFALVDDVSLVQVAPGTVTEPPPPPVVDTCRGPLAVVSSPVGSPVFQLPWGGAMSGSVYSNSNLLRRYSTTGVQVGAATPFNFPASGGSATVLEGGGYAQVWIVRVAEWPLSSYQLYTQAFTATAQPIGSPFAIAFTAIADNNPAAVPHMAPLAGGGYVVVWALQQSAAGAANDRGVYTQRFDANGQPAGPARQATTDGAGFLHIIGTTSGGYVVSWGELTGTVGGARAYGGDGAPLAPEQVAGDSWDIGAGPRGSIAPLAGGGAAIVWQVRDQPVYVQHISASGAALPAQVASSLTAPGIAVVAVAGLPDGGSVVAWVEIPLGGVGVRAVYARRFAADGTPLGPQTRVNLTTTPTNATEIMVLADGRFTISWDVGTSRYGRTFPANGLVAP